MPDKVWKNAVMVSSKNEVWNTPKDLFRRLDDEFHFNLDVASNDDNALCEKHFTEETDGLKQDWGGGILYGATLRTAVRQRTG